MKRSWEHDQLPGKMTKYQSNIQRIDELLSEKYNFKAFKGSQTTNYAILASPRSGSSLVSHLLFGTGKAGAPFEYLNPHFIAWFLYRYRVNRKTGRTGYLQQVQSLRTSANGYFGIKLHFAQLTQFNSASWGKKFQIDTTRLISDLDYRILLLRKDQYAQAVSFYRAINSRKWFIAAGTMPENEPHDELRFKPEEIVSLYDQIRWSDDGWLSMLRQLDLPYNIFYYEDFLSAYDTTGMALLNALGIDTAEMQPPTPALARQSNEHDPLVQQFKQYMNVN